MSVSEIASAFQWLYQTLSPDNLLTTYAPGGIHRGMAPPNTETPFVVFNLQSANDVVTINGVRMLVDGLFQVKAVGESSKTELIMSAASRIDDLIGSPPASGTVTSGYIASSYRQSVLSIDELVSGELWNSTGGLYRIIIEQIN